MSAGTDARPVGAAVRVPVAPRPWHLLRRLAGDLAEERIYRVLAFAFLPAAVAFGLLAAPNALAQRGAWPAWWSVTAFIVGTVPSLVQGAAAFSIPLPALRVIAGVNAAGALLVQASIPFVAHHAGPIDGRAWFIDIASLGLIASTLALRPGGVVVVAVSGALLTAVDRLATDRTAGPVGAAQDGSYVLLFVVTFTALGVALLIAGRAADEAEAAAQAITGDVAADAARERERARVNALVHDRVLATLLTAARRIPGTEAMERRDAARALAGLHALLDDGAVEQDLDGEAFAWQVQSATTQLLPEALFHYSLSGSSVVPGPVVDAMLAAAEEAMRNSRSHAEAENRTVHVEIGDDGVRVDVLDDGVGFDRAGVPAARLGIAESIEGRVRALPGGSVDVVSQPGVGTRVALRWAAP